MPKDPEWSWVGEDGVKHDLGEDELTFALSSEEIPAYTLVSHITWAEWLPAMQVAELVWALPSGHADSPRKAEQLDRSAKKRGPDLADYAELKARFDDIRSGRVDPKTEAQSGPKLAPPSGGRPRSKELDLATVKDSDLESILDNLDALGSEPPRGHQGGADVATGVPRPEAQGRLPAGSVKPTQTAKPKSSLAPRGKLPSFADSPPSAPRREMPSSSSLGPPPPPRREMESNGSLAPSSVRRPPSPRRSETDSSPRLAPAPALSLDLELAALGDVPPPSIRPPVVAAPMASEVRESSAEPPIRDASSVPPEPSPPRASRPSLPAPVPLTAPTREELAEFRRGPRAMRYLLALGALVAVGGGVWFIGRNEDPKPPPAAPTEVATTPPPAPRQLITRCRLGQEPTRVFDLAKPDVKPVFSAAMGPSRVALGFAQTSRLALGLTLSAANLSASVGARQDDPSPMLSVVPALRGGEPEFLVERAASRLQMARAVPAEVPFAIGVRDKTIASRRGKEDRDLWPSPWDTVSVPEVMRIDSNTHAVAIRGGGLRGSILLGKVDERGQALGELGKLELAAARVGEPALHVTEKGVWVAVDGGPSNDLGRLFVGFGARPELPRKADPVAVAAGEHASLPSLVGLPSGELFLQWTEGPIGGQKIVGRVFDAGLEPRGETLTLSQAGSDAHHGVSTLVGDRLITVYFVRLPNNHELWASALTCTSGEP